MNIILCIDFGSTYTKLTAIDVTNEVIVGTAKSITTINTSIMDGYNDALAQLMQILPSDVNIIRRLGCSSAAGGLKMAVIGNVPELTADAAKKAALGAGARVMKTYHFDISEAEIEEINTMGVDIILLAGGTDGGNFKYITSNAKKISENIKNIPVIVAGNKSAQTEIKELFTQSGIDFYLTENIMPALNELNIEPVRNQIRSVFMNKIINAKGLNKAIDLVDNEIIPTPLSILHAAKHLSIGSDTEDGIGTLIIVDIGGATTDVHSCCYGLPTKGDVVLKGVEEPYDKRTVEGDLGMRYSAKSLQEAVSTKMLAKYLRKYNVDLSNDEIKEQIDLRSKNINFVPQTEEDELFDRVMAMACTREGMNRHAGYVETVFTPFGQTYMQVGKDLLYTEYLIGTGGVLVHSPKPGDILREGFYNIEEPNVLKPTKAKLLLDKEYVLSALGLLCSHDADVAVRIMKKYLLKID